MTALGWNLGVLATMIAVIDAKVTGREADQIKGIIANTAVPSWWWLGTLVVAAYFLFLSTLPKWLLKDELPKKKDNQE